MSTQKQKLNKYAVNKLKQLATEITKKSNQTLEEIHLLNFRKEIYTTLLEESNKPEF